MEFARRPDENGLDRFLRLGLGLSARVIPSLRERRRLERMAGPVGVWDAVQRYQLSCLRRFGLTPRHRLLDIGCGPLLGGLAFIRYLEPGGYCGIDVSQHVISEAEALIARHELLHKWPSLWRCGAFGRRTLGDRQFDYIWMSQLLYHLDGEQLDACFAEVARRLAPGGRFLGDAKVDSQRSWRTEHGWAGYPFHFRTVEELESRARSHGLALTTRGQIRDHGYPTRWTYSLPENELLELTLA